MVGLTVKQTNTGKVFRLLDSNLLSSSLSRLFLALSRLSFPLSVSVFVFSCLCLRLCLFLSLCPSLSFPLSVSSLSLPLSVYVFSSSLPIAWRALRTQKLKYPLLRIQSCQKHFFQLEVGHYIPSHA